MHNRYISVGNPWSPEAKRIWCHVTLFLWSWWIFTNTFFFLSTGNKSRNTCHMCVLVSLTVLQMVEIAFCCSTVLIKNSFKVLSSLHTYFFPFQLSFRCWYVKQNGKNQHPALLPWYAQPICQNCWWRYRKDWKWLYQVIFSFLHSQEDRLLHNLWNSCSSGNGS